MKYVFLQLLLILSIAANAQTSTLIGKKWLYKKIVLIYQQDSLYLFNADSVNNHWYLGKVSMNFKSDYTYVGTDINGQLDSGTWVSPTSQLLVVGKDTNQVLSVSSHSFKTTAAIRFRDPVTDISGTLYTEFYSIPIPGENCISLQSGNWTSPATWSCGHVPAELDKVSIQPNHTVLLDSSMPEAYCQNLEILGTFSMQGGAITVNGARIVVDQDNILTK